MNMSNSYDKVSEILQVYELNQSISKSLIDANLYYAHTPKQKGNKIEMLQEHLHLVQKYFEKLVAAHGLDKAIDRLIDDYLTSVSLESTELGNFIKKLFVLTVCYHDHGKINENFQASPDKMNNPHFYGKENEVNKIGTNHSTLSSFIYISHLIDDSLEKFSSKEQRCAITLTLLYSYPIYKHHSHSFQNDFWEKIFSECQRVEQLKPYLEQFKSIIKNEKLTGLLGNLKKFKEQQFFNPWEKSFPLYQLLRLNFSLLTASDFLATNQYMSGFPVKDFGVLSSERINELNHRIQRDEWIDENLRKINFNKKTFDELETLSLEKPTEKSNQNLNLLRQQMATEAIRNIRENHEKRIFYLEAPTGGGKTNISMLLALELLKQNSELNKVYYVFPFTTLIDQTFQSIQQSLNLSDKEIVALHSKASIKNDQEDDEYGVSKKNYINRLFVNYPFCLLSHVRFFEILKTNFKETNYLLHRLANSVVVIDELQTFNPKHWDKVMYFIKKYADAYNIRFIIMSATLPKIGNLKIDGLQKEDIAYLLPNAKEDYFQNINFAGRVNFDFSLLPHKIELPDLAQKVLEESKIYAEIDGGKAKPQNSVYTIIEFIFKRTATRFKAEIENIHDDFFDEIFVLSGTILHHRRRHIINFLKRAENRQKRILLITTQVVEAGVDIDMDLGFKDTSLLDSDEQLAGRINRNVNKERCKLFLFHHNPESIVYKDDLRLEMTKKELKQKDKEEILTTKNFDLLYQKVLDFKDERNQNQNFAGLNQYTNLIKDLQFRSVSDEFKLIEQENFSLYIPLQIPIEVDGENELDKEAIFSKRELKTLEVNGIFLDVNDKICGKQVFDLYLSIIHSNQSFTDRKIELKELQPILSKFVISVFATNKLKMQLTTFSDDDKSEFGYLYMRDYEKFYKEESGIDENEFENTDNQFL